MVLHALHLCSGYGGFELALRLAGVESRTVAHVERDTYAAATLVARMDDQTLDRAPVWSDLTTFDGGAWRGRVDLITAGFPCQPFSSAGQGRGVDDERWLWPDIARIVADVGPRFVFLENVPQLVRLGLPHVVADLAELGFDAEWGLLSASAVGAPHRRQRFWLLAYTDLDGLRGLGREPEHDRHARDDADRSCGSHVGHPGGSGRPEIPRSTHADECQHARRATIGTDLANGSSEDVADPESSGCEGGRRCGRPAALPEPPVDRSIHVADSDGQGREGNARAGRDTPEPVALRFPPLPDDHDRWERWLAEGGPEPQVRRGVDGRPVGLADALHLGGNGLVPRVAAAALAQLVERAVT